MEFKWDDHELYMAQGQKRAGHLDTRVVGGAER